MSTNEPNPSDALEVEATLEPEVKADAGQNEAKPDGAQAEPQPRVEPPPDFREIRIQMLERALQERESTLHSYIRAHKKAQEEFDAYKARLERDRERELVAAKAKFVERLLDVDDNLERTIAAARGSGGNDAMITGIEMVHRQFVERLTELGLERFDPIGQPFDPSSMEALGVVAVNDPSHNDKVVLTMRTGYRLGEREIRPALVQVGRFYS